MGLNNPINTLEELRIYKLITLIEYKEIQTRNSSFCFEICVNTDGMFPKMSFTQCIRNQERKT